MKLEHSNHKSVSSCSKLSTLVNSAVLEDPPSSYMNVINLLNLLALLNHAALVSHTKNF